MVLIRVLKSGSDFDYLHIDRKLPSNFQKSYLDVYHSLCSKFERIYVDILKNWRQGTRHHVVVSHINHPHDFYVVPAKFLPYMYILISYELNESFSPKVKDKVLYKSKEKNGEWLRGLILADNKFSYNVLAMDHGFCENNVHYDYLRELSSESKQIPGLAVRCQMDMCYPIHGNRDWDAAAIAAFKQVADQKLSHIDIKGGDPKIYIVVTLWNDYPSDVATVLLYADHAFLVSTNTNIYSEE